MKFSIGILCLALFVKQSGSSLFPVRLMEMTSEPCHLEELVEPGSVEFFVYVLVAAFCVCCGGLMSGLTVGFMSIDRLKLQGLLVNLNFIHTR